jgi:flagellar protein FlgJ
MTISPLNPMQGLPMREAPNVDRNPSDLRQAAQGFEALFIQQMLKSARETSFDSELLGGHAVETSQSLLDQNLADIGAGRAGLGLADAIERQFSAVMRRR